MKAVTEHIVEHDGGATAIEYALLAAMIALVILTAVTTLGSSLDGLFTFIQEQL